MKPRSTHKMHIIATSGIRGTLVACALLLSGCTVVSVTAAVGSAAVTVGSAAVGVATTAVGVTYDVTKAGVNALSGSDAPAEP